MDRVEQALELVNSLAVTSAYGRSLESPRDADEVRTRASAVLPGLPGLSTAQAAELQSLAATLAQVLERIAAGREDDAADTLNALLARSGARPHLHRHDDSPFHLHFHDPDAGPVEGWTAGCAAGLAFVIGTEHVKRIGRCAAPACDRFYLDTSRNGSRRFCGTACQNRVKAAAHRARHRPG